MTEVKIYSKVWYRKYLQINHTFCVNFKYKRLSIILLFVGTRKCLWHSLTQQSRRSYSITLVPSLWSQANITQLDIVTSLSEGIQTLCCLIFFPIWDISNKKICSLTLTMSKSFCHFSFWKKWKIIELIWEK